jgi:hypothetical protein
VVAVAVIVDAVPPPGQRKAAVGFLCGVAGILPVSAAQVHLRQEVHYTFTGASRRVPLPHLLMTSGISKRNMEWADAEAAA